MNDDDQFLISTQCFRWALILVTPAWIVIAAVVVWSLS